MRNDSEVLGFIRDSLLSNPHEDAANVYEMVRYAEYDGELYKLLNLYMTDGLEEHRIAAEERLDYLTTLEGLGL